VRWLCHEVMPTLRRTGQFEGYQSLACRRGLCGETVAKARADLVCRDGVDLAAIGDCDAGPRDPIKTKPLPQTPPKRNLVIVESTRYVGGEFHEMRTAVQVSGDVNSNWPHWGGCSWLHLSRGGEPSAVRIGGYPRRCKWGRGRSR
jgi:hypothetical protein